VIDVYMPAVLEKQFEIIVERLREYRTALALSPNIASGDELSTLIELLKAMEP